MLGEIKRLGARDPRRFELHALGNLVEVLRDQVHDKNPSFRKARSEFVFNRNCWTSLESSEPVLTGLRKVTIGGIGYCID